MLHLRLSCYKPCYMADVTFLIYQFCNMAEPCGHVTPQLFCAGFSRNSRAPRWLSAPGRDSAGVACGLPGVSREARAAWRAPEARSLGNRSIFGAWQPSFVCFWGARSLRHERIYIYIYTSHVLGCREPAACPSLVASRSFFGC